MAFSILIERFKLAGGKAVSNTTDSAKYSAKSAIRKGVQGFFVTIVYIFNKIFDIHIYTPKKVVL